MAPEKKKVVRKPRITLQGLIKQDLPIWVRNNTGTGRFGKLAGIVSIQVGNGLNVGWIRVPPGTEPVCISDQVDPESLKSCRDLFQLIRSGALELLDPEKAEEYYEQNEERRKVMEDKIDKLLRATPDDVPLPQEVKHGKLENLHPQIQDICLKARHKAITERQALEKLIEQSVSFSLDDLNYIASNGTYNAVKTWAKDQIKTRQEGEFDPIEAAS